jgi:hypothetical protein
MSRLRHRAISWFIAGLVRPARSSSRSISRGTRLDFVELYRRRPRNPALYAYGSTGERIESALKLGANEGAILGTPAHDG